MSKKLNKRLKTTFIGCGQCGCQIVSEIEKRVMELDGTKDNTSFVGINSSLEDLSAVNLSHKIHMKNCTGAAGNRNRSLDALAESIDEILPELQKYIIDGSTVFVAFSMGGGTGSAIGPVLAKILLEMGYKVCLILVLPSDAESLRIRDNARQTFDEIEELKPELGSIFILDNNAMDKLQINKIFATLITAVLCINNHSLDGNMDLAEIETCLHCPSFSIIVATNATNGNTGNIVDILNRDNNIFAKREDKTISIMGVSEAVSAKESNLMNVLQYSKDVTGASGSTPEQVLAGIKNDLKTSGQDLLASLRQYEENSKLIGEQTTSWQQLTKDVSEMLSVLKDVKKALKESERDDDDEDEDDDSSSKKKHHSKSDGPGKSAWSNKDENNGPGAEINRKKAGIAHSGLEAGVVGKSTEDSEEAWMKSMGLKELDPKEYPYILKAGEQIVNAEQRHRLISNVDKGYGQAYADGLKKGIEAMSKSSTQVNNASYTVNAPIDKIVLQNVQDPDGFAKALYENLSLTMAQQRSKFKF